MGRAQAEGLPTKIDSEGVIRIYDPATNTFGSYNADGTTRTFYKPYGGEPKKAQAYFDRQPGNSPNLLGGP
ncbi:Pyocin large subunit-like protein (fragment) [Methylacidimicrobium sp. AP8]